MMFNQRSRIITIHRSLSRSGLGISYKGRTDFPQVSENLGEAMVGLTMYVSYSDKHSQPLTNLRAETTM